MTAMHTTLAPTLLAAALYTSLPKILTVLVLFVLWTLGAQWADRDVERINKPRREWWNLLILGGGGGGIAVLLLIPWPGAAFFLGLAFWIILGGGTLLAYVVHRNGRVGPSARVLTPTHLKKVLSGKGGGKAEREDRGVRVRLMDSEGKAISKPTEPEERERFDVAQDFLFDMLWKRSTDADLVVGAEATRVVYKIDGVASEQEGLLTPENAEKLLSFMKQAAGLSMEERRRPQAGQMRAGLLGSTGKPDRMEVVTSGSTQGERMRLRINRSQGLLALEDLGFSEPVLKQFKAAVAKESGLVVFAGPRESGITTTEYAALRTHDAYLQNVYSLETSVMQDLDNITQQVFDPNKVDVSYARMLQTILRREPDVVLVDQCEDRETAQLACRAATDKKIYLTVRAGSCADAIARLQALLDDHKLLAGALVGVVSQRLVRVLCEACREAYKPDEQLLRKANIPADQVEHFYRPPSEPILDKKGRVIVCQTCQNSHYVGRTGVFEFMPVSDAVRKLLAAGAPAKQIKAQARSEKMRYLQEDGLIKVIAGKTSMAEIMRGLRSDAK
ncbi:MAG: Flp pilus assembly complex ATPase component TadA [Phycisphaerales bacterium]|nr:Flp pilus assembly complex ATPase component TadA [Phycisphaerales bacterium]